MCIFGSFLGVFFVDALILSSTLSLVENTQVCFWQVGVLRECCCGREKLAVVHFAKTCMQAVVCEKKSGPFKNRNSCSPRENRRSKNRDHQINKTTDAPLWWNDAGVSQHEASCDTSRSCIRWKRGCYTVDLLYPMQPQGIIKPKQKKKEVIFYFKEDALLHRDLWPFRYTGASDTCAARQSRGECGGGKGSTCNSAWLCVEPQLRSRVCALGQ